MIIPFFASWLASTILPVGAVWLLFRVLLRQEQCYGYNRVLLLLAPVVAAALPLLPRSSLLGWLPSTHMAALPGAASPAVWLPDLQVSAGPLTTWPGWHWLLGVYLLGVAGGLGRLAHQAWHLRRTARQLPREARPGYVVAYTGGQLPTSSFGHIVFWDETAELTAAEATTVLGHELAHVRQGHTYDVLWLEVWCAVLWPNPFSYLVLRALRLTHELLADRAAAQATTGPAAATAYVALLARLTARRLAGASYPPLVQSFTFSSTLTRIAMLQSKMPVRRWKQWLALPLLAGLCAVVGQSASAQTAPPPPPPKLMPAGTATPGGAVYTYVERMPALPGGGGTAAIVQQIQHDFVYPAGAHREGKVFASFIVGATGDVRDAKIVKGLGQPYDAAVLAAIQRLPRFIPGKQNGRAVAVSFTVPITFKEKP